MGIRDEAGQLTDGRRGWGEQGVGLRHDAHGPLVATRQVKESVGDHAVREEVDAEDV